MTRYMLLNKNTLHKKYKKINFIKNKKIKKNLRRVMLSNKKNKKKY